MNYNNITSQQLAVRVEQPHTQVLKDLTKIADLSELPSCYQTLATYRKRKSYLLTYEQALRLSMKYRTTRGETLEHLITETTKRELKRKANREAA